MLVDSDDSVFFFKCDILLQKCAILVYCTVVYVVISQNLKFPGWVIMFLVGFGAL